jgi:hypothetical protein
MKSLIEAVDYINKNYRQGFSDNQTNNVSTLFVGGPMPKFLYRGEAKLWEKTQSNASRNRLTDDPDFSEINYWITGRHLKIGVVQNNYSLYNFLRESLYGISVVDEYFSNPNLDKAIAGLLQHYGFDTCLIDFTSEIDVAAFFASFNSATGNEGQIFVLPTINIEDYVFDLSLDKASRPKKQKAFALVLPQDYDLKTENSLSFKKGFSIKFRLTTNDKERFYRDDLLSIAGDNVVIDIVNWFDCHIATNPQVSDRVKQYFRVKKEYLDQHCG